MGKLFDFAKERVGSLVSKKVGAAIIAEGTVAGTEYQGWPLMLYIIVQGLVDLGKHWTNSR